MAASNRSDEAGEARSPERLQLWCLAAALFALASGAWAAFLWQQLFVARSGAEPFCALGGGGCAALWDGAFASAIHEGTGLPVAAWGLVWSGAALVASLLAWNAARGGRNPEPFWSGAVVVAAAGALGVVVLLAASLSAGEFCSNCAITYVLVAAYAGAIAIGAAIRRPVSFGRGAAIAAATAAALFLVLLTPGLDTPKAGAELGTAALSSQPAGAEDPGDRAIEFVRGLPHREAQNVSLVRKEYIVARALAPRPVRALVGSESAPVRLTTFTDSGCSHCAHFHEALEAMLEELPADAMSVEQRMFPLDGACNSHITGRGRDQLCLAAKVRVCLEQSEQALDLSGWLHEDAAPLTEESIYRVATRLMRRDRLEDCVRSPETQAKIDTDADMGVEGGLRGTPFLLLNGKPVLTYVPFIYAMALTGGDVNHAAFADLPDPPARDPNADPHAGHNH